MISLLDIIPAPLLSYTSISILGLATFTYLIIDGFARLEGTPSPTRPRPSKATDTEYLLGTPMTKRCTFNLPSTVIKVTGNPTIEDEFDLSKHPPLLRSDGFSHFYLGRFLPDFLSQLIFKDVVINIPPISIPAPVEDVWKILLDFSKYGEWNGFHRDMQIVDKPDLQKAVGLRMTVSLGPILGTVVETSTMYYLDEKRHILVYGLRGDEGPSSMRCAWLTVNEGEGNSCTFHSYDMIGGYAALFSRGHITKMVHMGFNEQHFALKERVRVLQMRREDEAAAALVKKSRKVEDVRKADDLGVCLVTGGSGYLGAHVVRMLASLPGVTEVHVIDVNKPKRVAAIQPQAVPITLHLASVSDSSAMEKIFLLAKPNTVIHLASVIDLRPESVAKCEAINAVGTRTLLWLSKEVGTRRFVYTSSIETSYHSNTCTFAHEEDTPYEAHPTNNYQGSKIAAERAVRNADCETLSTVVMRPTHIVGHALEDGLVNYLKGIDVCFGNQHWLLGGSKDAALMSMVHVENCALSHVLAASQATRQEVSGRVFFMADFDENIVCIYHELGGKKPPSLCLPYWFLLILVRTSLFFHNLVFTLTFGNVALLSPMMGLHNGALSAALPCTVNGDRARDVLGYKSWVTREMAIGSRSDIEAKPLIFGKEVGKKVREACERVRFE